MKKRLSLAITLTFIIFLGACAIAPKVVFVELDAIDEKFIELQKEKDELAFQAQEDSELVVIGYKNGLYGIVFNSLVRPTCIDASWNASDFPEGQADSKAGIEIIPLQVGEIYSYLITIDPEVVKHEQFQAVVEYNFFGKDFHQLFIVHNDKRRDVEPSEEQ